MGSVITVINTISILIMLYGVGIVRSEITERIEILANSFTFSLRWKFRERVYNPTCPFKGQEDKLNHDFDKLRTM